MTELERNIIDAIARGRREGLEPKSVYLTPEHRAELDRLGHGETVGDLPIKAVTGKGRSVVYFKHGIARSIRPLQRLQARKPIGRRRPAAAGKRP